MQRLFAILAALALVLTACGGDDDDSAASDDAASIDDDGGDGAGGSAGAEASVDPCELLTIDDLTSRGIAAGDGPIEEERIAEGATACYFTNDEGGTDGVRLDVYAPDDRAFGIGDAEEIPGIGAEAIYSPLSRVIFIELDDGTRVDIYVPPSVFEGDPRDVLIELAEIAVG